MLRWRMGKYQVTTQRAFGMLRSLEGIIFKGKIVPLSRSNT
jgi:hypothetical protein